MENRQLVLALYEFVTCQRPDGSFYGNGGGNCRKGEERPLPEKSSNLLSPKISQALRVHSKELEKIWGDKVMSQATNDYLDYQKTQREYLDKINSGDLTPDDLQVLYDNSQIRIPEGVEVAFYGMEPGGGLEGSPKRLAQNLALASLDKGQFRRELMGTLAEIEMPGSRGSHLDSDVPSGQYVFKMGDLFNRFKENKYEGGLKVSSFRHRLGSNGNFSPIPVVGQSQAEWDRTWGNLLSSQKRSEEFKDWQKRSSHDKRFSEFRIKKILGEVRKAYTEGNLKLAASFPGAKYSKTISQLVNLHKSSGGKVFKTTSDFGSAESLKGKSVFLLEITKGKYFVVSPVHPNAYGWSTDRTESSIRKALLDASSGILEEI